MRSIRQAGQDLRASEGQFLSAQFLGCGASPAASHADRINRSERSDPDGIDPEPDQVRLPGGGRDHCALADPRLGRLGRRREKLVSVP